METDTDEWPGVGQGRGRTADLPIRSRTLLVCPGHYLTVPASCIITERDRLLVPNICHHVPPQCGGKVGCRS